MNGLGLEVSLKISWRGKQEWLENCDKYGVPTVYQTKELMMMMKHSSKQLYLKDKSKLFQLENKNTSSAVAFIYNSS